MNILSSRKLKNSLDQERFNRVQCRLWRRRPWWFKTLGYSLFFIFFVFVQFGKKPKKYVPFIGWV